MTTSSEILITLPGGRRVDAMVRGHIIHTDQPTDKGGNDAAPSPFELFLASLGACAGIFIQGFCAQRSLPTENIHVVERPHFDTHGHLTRVELEVQLPTDFPEKYRAPLLRVVEQCSVKRTIAEQPPITVTLEGRALVAVQAAH